MMRGSAGQSAQSVIASSGAVPAPAPAAAPVAAPVAAAPDDDVTSLSPAEEQQYQSWAQETGRVGDDTDYDQRGAWKSGWRPKSREEHGPDTYKRRNHPTFSDESSHSKPGMEGGHWTKLPGGKWSFTASPWNVRNLGAEGLKRYFQEREPGNTLILPDQGAR
jgi:hypothetical protein